MTDRTYARVYHEIVDDDRFARVYGDDAALGCWLRMLLVADAVYPQSAPMPHRNSRVRLLIAVGLIEERPGNRYIVHGLEAERERRSASSRIGAVKRWQSERNANAMPSKAEQEQSKSNGANASDQRPFMGFRQRIQPSVANVRAQHEDAFQMCGSCGERKGGPKHGAGRDHEFVGVPA